MKTLILAALLAVSAVGQQSEFRVQLSRWSNHDIPAELQGLLPIPNGVAKLDGIMAVVTVENGRELEAVEVTLLYRQGGKKMKQVRTVILGTTGCSPEPCRWAPILFDVGVVDSLDEVKAEVKEWATE